MTLAKGEKPVRRSSQTRQNRQQSVPVRTGSSSTAGKAAPRKTGRSTNSREAVATQPRRKVVYKVGANGVETRLPAIPLLRFSWQWISGILTVLLFLLFIFMVNSPIFKVQALTVNGLTRYSPEDFQSLIKERRTSIFLFDTNAVMHSLRLVFPELVDTQIAISMPNQVIISASERQPIILWQAGGTDYWIDAEGIVMQKRGDLPDLLTVESSVPPPLAQINTRANSIVDYARMIIERQSSDVTIDKLVDHMDPGALGAVIELSAILPAGGSLVYDPISGMGWRDPGGWEVYFGTDLTNMDLKQVEYQTILARLMETGVSPAMISVEHIYAPYFRME